MSTLNKSTRIIIALLTSLFFIAQMVLVFATLSVATLTISLLFGAALEESPSGNGIMLLGIDTTNYDFSFLSEQQFVFFISLLTFVICILAFFLFHYLRTLLQNLDEGEVFSSYNLTFIRRIMLFYLSIQVLFFSCKLFCAAASSRYIILGLNNLFINLLQVFLMTAGIYTLYFVFKYGVNLKKDNEAIV